MTGTKNTRWHAKRAPKGGVVIDGRFYRGGCFVPANYEPEPELPPVEKFIVGGKTYPHRALLAAAGGEWDSDAKVWRFECRFMDLPRCARQASGIYWRRAV